MFEEDFLDISLGKTFKVSICIDKISRLEVSAKGDPNSLEDLISVLEEIVVMLKSPSVEDNELF